MDKIVVTGFVGAVNISGNKIYTKNDNFGKNKGDALTSNNEQSKSSYRKFKPKRSREGI